MVGYAIGAVIAMVLGGKGLHFKYLFAMGFFFLSLSAVFMYFEVQTAGVYERLEICSYHPCHRHDDSVCGDGCLCQSTYAF